MAAANIDMVSRDFCAHILIKLNDCRCGTACRQLVTQSPARPQLARLLPLPIRPPQAQEPVRAVEVRARAARVRAVVRRRWEPRLLCAHSCLPSQMLAVVSPHLSPPDPSPLSCSQYKDYKRRVTAAKEAQA